MAGRSGPMVVGVAAAVLAVIGVSVAMSSGDETRPSGASGPAGSSSAGSDSDAHVVAPRSQQQRIDVPLTLPIQSYVLLAPDRLQVRYTTGVPECYGRLDRAVVTESPSRVVVTLRLRPAPTPPTSPAPTSRWSRTPRCTSTARSVTGAFSTAPGCGPCPAATTPADGPRGRPAASESRGSRWAPEGPRDATAPPTRRPGALLLLVES